MARQNKLPRELLRIEEKLQGVLQPVSPRPAYVEDLRLQLDQEMVRKSKTKKVKIGLMIAGGLVGVAVMVITIIRSLTAWESIFQAISKAISRLRKREQAVSV
jgi:hypothetical protein